MLERCCLRIVPMVAIDAVVTGSPYGGPYYAMARRWLDDDPLPEIAATKELVRELFHSKRVRLIGKVHGGQTYENAPVWDFRIPDLALRKLNAVVAAKRWRLRFRPGVRPGWRE